MKPTREYKKLFRLCMIGGMAGAMLAGCGGGGGGGSDTLAGNSVTTSTSAAVTTTTVTTTTTTTTTTAATVLSGVIVDSPIQGLEYSTPTLSGVTDADGKFSYRAGETVTFSMGGVAVGSAPARATMTLYSLVQTAVSNNDQRVLNIAKLLQSLDSGGDLNARIVISAAARSAVGGTGGINFDQTTSAFATDPKITQVMTTTGKTLRDDAAVTTHLNSQIAALSVRDTNYGKVAGKLSSVAAAYNWLGIPYAAAPVGSRRWKASEDPAPWSTTFNATNLGKACIQSTTGTYAALYTGTSAVASVAQSEDCLNLNIWAPASGETNLPVIVYVHGGSNTVGYGAQYPQWGGTFAADQKAVFVSINYRLNVFGWLNHTALKTGDPLADSGNFGTLDIIQALKFVKNNIANFGGDPNNVTLAGESAGANNTWTLLMSPKASGLFHKALAMSGGLTTTKTVTAGQSYANTILRKLIVNDNLATNDSAAGAYLATLTNTQIRDYLYGKTTTQLLNAFLANSSTFTDRFMDGTVLPPDSATAFTGAYLNSVPVLAGNTNEEGKHYGSYFALGTNGASFNLLYAPLTGGTTPIMEQIIRPEYLYPNRSFTSCTNAGYSSATLNASFVYDTPSTWCGNGVYNTTFFWWYQTISLNRYQPLQSKVYAFNFAWNQQAEPFKSLLGAAHARDIPFMFGNLTPNAAYTNVGFNSNTAAGREALSAKMRKSLGAFMRTGDPNNDSLGTTWLPWSTANGGANRLIFDADANNATITMSTGNAPIPR